MNPEQTPNFVVREATPADYPALAHLLAESFGRGKFSLALGRDLAVRERRMALLLPYGVVCPGQVFLGFLDDALATTFTLRTLENVPSAEQYDQARAALSQADNGLRARWAIALLRRLIGPQVTAEQAYLDNLATDTQFRRMGLGTRTIQVIYETTRTLGKKRLVADVMSSNVRIVNFYQKEGFHVVGRNYWLAPITWPLLGTPGVLRIHKTVT